MLSPLAASAHTHAVLPLPGLTRANSGQGEMWVAIGRPSPEDRQKAEAETKRKADEAERKRLAALKAEEDRRRAAEETKRKAEIEAKQKAAELSANG